MNGVGEFPTGCTYVPRPAAATGAHLAHVNQTDLRSARSTCDNCHGTMPPAKDITHADGVKLVGWSTLATGNGSVVPTPANGGGFVTTP